MRKHGSGHYNDERLFSENSALLPAEGWNSGGASPATLLAPRKLKTPSSAHRTWQEAQQVRQVKWPECSSPLPYLSRLLTALTGQAQ